MIKIIFLLVAIWNILMFFVDPYSFINFLLGGVSVYYIWATYRDQIIALWNEEFGDD